MGRKSNAERIKEEARTALEEIERDFPQSASLKEQFERVGAELFLSWVDELRSQKPDIENYPPVVIDAYLALSACLDTSSYHISVLESKNLIEYVQSRSFYTIKFIYYSGYSNHSMTTTIQLSEDTKSLIGTFGTKEDTYEDILKRMYRLAVKEQLRELLLSSEKTISPDEARNRLVTRWPK